MRVLIGLFALLATACSAQTGPGPILIETEAVPLYPNDPGRLDVGRLEYRGGIVLTSSDERFGGLSALEFRNDHILAISDSAYWFAATLEFDENDWLVSLSNTFYAPMLDENGEHLTGDRADAEGLADLGNGRFAVSFEREHRIWVYDVAPDWSGVAIATPAPMNAPPGADRLRNNGGMEALAIGNHAFWAAVEYPIVDGRPHTIWRMPESGEAEALPYPAENGFGLTGMDMDGAGQAYVVERQYVRDIGNTIRITRFSQLHIRNEQLGEEMDLVAILTPDMTVDNIEGIAHDHFAGNERLFLISDDNFNGQQRTLLLSFAIMN